MSRLWLLMVVSAVMLLGCAGPGTRSPVSGDTGVPVAPDPYAGLSPSARARAITDADRQPPETTNGNQPDRTAAGVGGSR